MADLASRQAEFIGALMAGDGAEGNDRRGFGVYRNNVFASLTAVLGVRFPVVKRLTGEEFFAATVHDYIRLHPPTAPVLLEYGETFSVFLDAYQPAAGLPFLPDIARLEWLRHDAFHAADCPALSAAAFANIDTTRVGDLIFTLHPSLRLITSPYPVFSIWETNIRDAEVRAIGPEQPGEAALIIRPVEDVVVLRLDPGEFAFVSALAAGATLSGAVRTASSVPFSLSLALARLINAGVFTSFHLNTGE